MIAFCTGKNVQHSIANKKLLALGSIFFSLSDNDTVWGSGFLNASHIQFARSCRGVSYLAVRGPETRKLLIQHDIDCPQIYGDPALLLPLLIQDDLQKNMLLALCHIFLITTILIKCLKKIKMFY